MRTFGLSLFLLMLGIASVNAQTASGSDPAVTTAPLSPSQKEPSLEADAPKIGSTAGAGELEHSRLATRPPTPLISK